jgi:hypothetical protein
VRGGWCKNIIKECGLWLFKRCEKESGKRVIESVKEREWSGDIYMYTGLPGVSKSRGGYGLLVESEEGGV